MAEKRLLEALSVQEKKLPKNNENLGATLACLTLVYKATKQQQKAIKFYSRALPIMQAKLVSLGMANGSSNDRPEPISVLHWWHNEDMALLKDIGSQFESDFPTSCFIATAVFQSRAHPAVVTLRSFRERKLANSWWGRSFIVLYRHLSPPIARTLCRHKQLRSAIKCILRYIVRLVEIDE